MKVLLINTPINIKDTLGNFSSVYDDLKMVPTGLASLAAYVRRGGVQVRILDQYAECLSMEAVLNHIADDAPDLIGLSATTPNYYAALDFTRIIKKRFPDIPTVMGGYHPSILPEETLRESCVDYVIRDEGEHPLLELCRVLEARGRGLDRILGLSFKQGDRLIHNEKTPP